MENVTSNITNKAKEIGAEVEKQAEYAGQYLSSKASAVAQSIKDHVPTRSDIESAASNVANKIERGGRYVAERDLDELAQDFTILIRKNPALSVAAGIGLGFLLGKTLKSK